jgi:hypothetical protein
MYELTPDTEIEIQHGLQSIKRKWNELAFVYIGSKNKELKRIATELTNQGITTFDIFDLVHPDFDKRNGLR